MLLAIDVGNTNITCAVISGEKTMASFRLTTKKSRTSDEFGIIVCDLLEKRGVDQNQKFVSLSTFHNIHRGKEISSCFLEKNEK